MILEQITKLYLDRLFFGTNKDCIFRKLSWCSLNWGWRGGQECGRVHPASITRVKQEKKSKIKNNKSRIKDLKQQENKSKIIVFRKSYFSHILTKGDTEVWFQGTEKHFDFNTFQQQNLKSKKFVLRQFSLIFAYL